jgi:hypothetical protein
VHVKDFCLCPTCIARIGDDEDPVPFHRRVGALEAIAKLRRGDAFKRRIVTGKAKSN